MAAIELIEDSLPARTTFQGSTSVSLAAGKNLKIETSPAGEELLNADVPAGKTWAVTVNVYVQET